MNIHLHKGLYLETFPFFVLAFLHNEYSTKKWGGHAFWQVQILNSGLRYKLTGSTHRDEWRSIDKKE
ncbi:MAG: hypothetical protein ACLFM1_05855 [Bacteroidales bacterium]